MSNKYFGVIATDKVTGFTGVVIGKASYISGCDQYLLAPECSDASKKPEGHWFDFNRLTCEEGDGRERIILEVGEGLNDNGADMEAPIK